MKHLRVFSALILVVSFTGCKSDPDERVYGTWTEVLTGETIEFRPDRTVVWMGHEGTFQFKTNGGGAGCIGVSGCYSGQVAVDAGGQSFRIPYRSSSFNENPSTWGLNFRTYLGLSTEIAVGDRQASHFTVYRAGTVVSPFVPTGFERLDQGLPSFQPYFKAAVSQNGTVVAQIDLAVYKLDSQNATWILQEDDNTSVLTFRPEIIFNMDHYSVDSGDSWHDLPFLEGDNFEGEFAAMGTRLFATVRHDFEESASRFETWSIEVNGASPAWQLEGTSTASNVYGHQITTIPQGETLVRTVWLEESLRVELSGDHGGSWSLLANSCEAQVVAHTQGFYCETGDGSFAWYDLESGNWSTITTNYDHLVANQSHIHDGIYVVKAGSLVKITANAVETTVTALTESPKGFGDVFILDGQILLHNITVWRQEL